MFDPLLAAALDLERGPSQTGDFRVSPTAFLLLLVFGLLVGAAGHLWRSRTLVLTGVAMVLLATIAIPLYLAATR